MLWGLLNFASDDVPASELIVPIARAVTRQARAQKDGLGWDCSTMAVFMAHQFNLLAGDYLHASVLVGELKDGTMRHDIVQLDCVNGDRRWYDPQRPRQIQDLEEISRYYSTWWTKELDDLHDTGEYRLTGRFHVPNWTK